MTVSCVVYYTFKFPSEERVFSIKANDISDAMKISEGLRKQQLAGDPISHICTSTENSDMIGQLGVDSIVDGKTPSGDLYTWKKRRI